VCAASQAALVYARTEEGRRALTDPTNGQRKSMLTTAWRTLPPSRLKSAAEDAEASSKAATSEAERSGALAVGECVMWLDAAIRKVEKSNAVGQRRVQRKRELGETSAAGSQPRGSQPSTSGPSTSGPPDALLGPDGVDAPALDPLQAQRRMDQRVKRQKRMAASCNCKNSNCRKGWCVCFQRGQRCTAACKCADCHNAPTTAPDASAVPAAAEAGQEEPERCADCDPPAPAAGAPERAGPEGAASSPSPPVPVPSGVAAIGSASTEQ